MIVPTSDSIGPSCASFHGTAGSIRAREFGYRPSVSLPLGPLDPSEQHRAPLPPVQRLREMGRRAEQHEVVRRAATPQPQAARGPHVVELERTETLVRDGQLRKDTQPIARLYVGADGGWDRIRRAIVLAAPASKRGAPPH